MKKVRVLAVIVCVMTAANFVSAEIIQGINIDFVAIGNAGNAADATGYGAIGYNYYIGKYEITNAQWNTFTDDVGVPTGSDGGYSYSAYFTGAQQPTNCVSWYEMLQFCNYLTSGDKSKGVYQFSGDNTNPGSFQGIDRNAAKAAYGTIYVLPTEDEWYKAAYYKPDYSGYSLYANGTNTAPIVGVQSNYNNPFSGAPWNVGTGAQEQNGTFDMMGNVMEWNESLINRGGSCYYDCGALTSSARFSGGIPSEEYYTDQRGSVGFRIASIPEPATMLLLTLGGLVLRRKSGK
jgi:hypothetical protein